MLGDSDEIDLTDPLRDAGTDDYEGPASLDLGDEPAGCGHCSPAAPDLDPDGGAWPDPGGLPPVLIGGVLLTAGLFGLLVVACLRVAFGRW